MKKLVSVLLSVIFLLTAIPVVNVSAADLQWYEIEVENNYSVTITQQNDYAYYCFTPQETGFYTITSQGAPGDAFVYGYDYNREVMGYANSFYGMFFLRLYMEKGKTYYYVITCSYINEDTENSFTFSVEKLRDEDITPMQIGQGYDNINDSGNIYATSSFYSFSPQEDGYYAFYTDSTYANSYAKAYDSEWNCIGEDEDSGKNRNCSLAVFLEKSKTYYFEVTKEPTSYTCVAYIEPTVAVVSFNVLHEPYNRIYYEGFVEETIDFSGLELELIYSDGSKLEWSYDENTEVVGTTISVELVKQHESAYYYSIKAGLSEKLYFALDVLENKVDSISVYSMENISCIENQDGVRHYDQNTDEYYFVYRYTIPEDTKIQINYKNGTSKIVSYGDMGDGLSFECYDDQLSGNYWSVGKHPVTIEYYGATTQIEVEVKETPIAGITVDKEPKIQVPYTSDSFNPADITGLVFTINYKDGTSRTFTDVDYDLMNLKIDGKRYYSYEHKVDKPGVYPASIVYLGFDIEFNVVVLGRGDFDGDGKVTVLDATTLQRYIAGMHTPTYKEKQVADVDRDNVITVLDATYIQRYIAGLELYI